MLLYYRVVEHLYSFQESVCVCPTLVSHDYLAKRALCKFQHVTGVLYNPTECSAAIVRISMFKKEEEAILVFHVRPWDSWELIPAPLL